MVRTVLGLVLLAGMLAGCGEEKAASEPRPRVFDPGQLIWAERSTIHVGDRTYDVGRRIIESMERTPYGLYLEVTRDPIHGPFKDVFFDGTTMTEVPDVYSDVITSPDGELAAWIDRTGPERPAGRVAQVVVVDTRTGDPVFESSEGLGGEKGDDLGDRYEELPPSVVDLTADRLVWINSEGSGSWVTTDLATGTSEVSDSKPDLKPTSGYEFWSPDGKYRVDASRTGRLRVQPQQPDFGHRWQTQGGWRGDHTMLALGQDEYHFSYDPTKPDTTPGYLLSCVLDAGTCQQLATVSGARDVVFPGVDVEY
ncbi:MAG TPA: hypothetical protein VFT70_17175 [Nocardioides sp.]|nr:hypothetical protein [Nocardioides sp.]